ncbi:MAG: MFS transporter [Elusimicrobia bacterium]|nr:MFS transporter [Elusimicrobiota bacterium]MBD3411887.1 MFS transporter [Elusimicrobiota bacterium]
MRESHHRLIKVFSWALYDFANTIFSMNILSLYFALWVTVDMGGKDIYYSSAQAISTLAMIILMPLLGIISDEYKRRMPFLIFCTLLSVVATALIGLVDNLFLGLLFFIPAYFGFQVSIIFYDALLPQIAGSPSRVGRISGYGVALGYIGAIAGLKMIEPFVQQPGSDVINRSQAFIPTAVFFLLFALPCLIVIKDTEHRPVDLSVLKRFPSALRKLIATLKHVRDYPNFFLFLCSHIAYSEAINTIFMFMGIYAAKVIGFTQAQIINFLVVSTTSAALGSLVWGWLTDRWGNKTTMTIILSGWVIALTLAMLSAHKNMFWLVGPLAGICLGGVWVTGRSIVVQLAPKAKLGEFFGLYGLTGRFTAILGPMLWGITTYVFALMQKEELGYRIAVGTLLCSITLGLILFQFVRFPGKKESIDVKAASSEG